MDHLEEEKGCSHIIVSILNILSIPVAIGLFITWILRRFTSVNVPPGWPIGFFIAMVTPWILSATFALISLIPCSIIIWKDAKEEGTAWWKRIGIIFIGHFSVWTGIFFKVTLPIGLLLFFRCVPGFPD